MQTEEVQNLFRTPPVAFHRGHGIRQHFRGTVGTGQTLALSTSNVSLNSYTMDMLSGGTSRLTITTLNNPSGTGMNLSHNERVGAPRPGMSAAQRALDVVKRLNRIQGIIRAPIDQALQMEVYFGHYIRDNPWRGIYASGSTYVIDTAGVAPMAMIKLTCNNPVNPGWFSFGVSLAIRPVPEPAAPEAPRRGVGDVLDELGQGFGRMIRNIQSGHNPW